MHSLSSINIITTIILFIKMFTPYWLYFITWSNWYDTINKRSTLKIIYLFKKNDVIGILCCYLIQIKLK